MKKSTVINFKIKINLNFRKLFWFWKLRQKRNINTITQMALFQKGAILFNFQLAQHRSTASTIPPTHST